MSVIERADRVRLVEGLAVARGEKTVKSVKVPDGLDGARSARGAAARAALRRGRTGPTIEM